MRDRLARLVFQISVVLLVGGAVFLLGYESHRTGRWPHGFLQDSRTIARSLKNYGQILPPNLMHHAPAGASGEQATIHRSAQMPDGWFVIMGWDGDRGTHAAWLLDTQLQLQHTWTIDYRGIDPDGPLNGSDMPHGMVVMPDGSLVLNFDHADAMARFDACSEPMWVRQGVFHHSLDLAPDGSIWTWAAQGTPYGHHGSMLRFDAVTGATLEEIQLVDDVIQADRLAEIVMGTRADFGYRHFDHTPDAGQDLYHANDVEELRPEMADAFPMFTAGDLLISLRNIDLVAVLDRQTHRLKWWRHGPWVRQHDPDFCADGWISVYNNNTGRGRSEIVRIHPGSDEVQSALHDGSLRFYAGAMGKHQTLPSGQVLITVPEEGRVVLVDTSGDLVAEFNNLVDGLAGIQAHVSHAMWLPADYFSQVPGCTNGS